MNDYFSPFQSTIDINAHSILTLAHLGDGVFELMVRTKLATERNYTKNSMHKAVLTHVSATAQAVAFERIRDLLTPLEASVFNRGRNAHVRVPKSAKSGDYHTSTGMEALFGYLWLSGAKERLNQLFDALMG